VVGGASGDLSIRICLFRAGSKLVFLRVREAVC